MKMNRYNVADYKLFDVDDHVFLFLPSHCAVFEIEAAIKAILDRGRLLRAFTREEVLAGLLGPVEENRDFFEELVSRCVIVSEGKIAQDHGYPAVAGEMPIHTLVLQVTDACNLCCDYCYCRNHPRLPDSEKKMTPETARRAIDFLLSRSGKHNVLTLVFFGGEPLLNFDLISDAVDYSRERGFQQNKKFNFAVTTNATLLTQPIIDFFAEKQISVTVSMDGVEEIHDRHRRYLNGNPSYKVIVPKIKNLLQQMTKRPVAARVTVTEAAEEIPGTLKHLLDMGFAEAGFAPATTCDLRFQLQEAGMANLLRHFKDLCDQFMELAQKDKVLGFTNLIDLLVLIHEGEIKQYPCGAGLGLFCVDAEGRLYLCQRLVGHSAAQMGNIVEGVDESKAAAFRSDVQKDREPLCASCWARHICAGGCYQEALVREGTMSAPNSHYCRWIREWTDVGLNVYGRLAIERPGYLDRLAQLRGR
jgi:uncharacterized protein